MCGRFAQTFPISDIQREFHIDAIDSQLTPHENIFPGSKILTLITREGKTTLTDCKWGLVPSWAKDQKIGNKMINARAETVADKPSFRAALKSRRCLIIASGFYEWKKTPEGKVPYLITLTDRKLFAFAGLYETWSSPEGEIIQSCTIITTEANSLLKPIHDRMPVILSRDKEDIWLTGTPEQAQTLLKPYPAKEIQYKPAKLKNNHTNSDIQTLF